MTPTLVDRLAARAMTLATDALDDAMAELRRLADGDDQALERAIPSAWLHSSASPPATAPLSCWPRVRYEDPPAPA